MSLAPDQLTGIVPTKIIASGRFCRLRESEKDVYLAFACHATRLDPWAKTTNTYLQRVTGLSERAIQLAIRSLVAMRLLLVTAADRRGHRTLGIQMDLASVRWESAIRGATQVAPAEGVADDAPSAIQVAPKRPGKRNPDCTPRYQAKKPAAARAAAGAKKATEPKPSKPAVRTASQPMGEAETVLVAAGVSRSVAAGLAARLTSAAAREAVASWRRSSDRAQGRGGAAKGVGILVSDIRAKLDAIEAQAAEQAAQRANQATADALAARLQAQRLAEREAQDRAAVDRTKAEARARLAKLPAAKLGAACAALLSAGTDRSVTEADLAWARNGGDLSTASLAALARLGTLAAKGGAA